MLVLEFVTALHLKGRVISSLAALPRHHVIQTTPLKCLMIILMCVSMV